MDFVAFLNWLWQQIDKVLDWFGSQYDRLRSGAANALSWAIAYATAAYNNARNYIIDRVNAVIAYANWIIDYLSAYASDLYHEAINFAKSVLNIAYAAVNDAIDYVLDIASSLFNTALSKIRQAIETVQGWASDLVDAAIELLRHLFDPLLALKPVVDIILQLTGGNIITRLLSLVQTFYSQIVTFFNDPLGFILGLVWSQFVTFLCFALGYGLGSVKYTLPPIPVWGKNLGGGGGNPPIIPPIPGATLVRPVEPLYVSGYTFGTGHYGTDFGIIDGQEIHAAHSGVITVAGWSSVGYGNQIDISGDPYWSRYGHNKIILVSVGQTVQAGQVIAYGNSTGNSSGPHCHFELKIHGSYVDPVLYL